MALGLMRKQVLEMKVLLLLVPMASLIDILDELVLKYSLDDYHTTNLQIVSRFTSYLTNISNG